MDKQKMIDVLRYWHVEEFLLPQTLDEPDKLNNANQQSFTGNLHTIFDQIKKLQNDNEFDKDKEDFVWEFVVYGGIYKVERIKDTLLSVLDVEDDFEERVQKGQAASYALMFDSELKFKIDGVQVSTAPWAIKDIVKHKKLTHINYAAFQSLEDKVKEELNENSTLDDYEFKRFLQSSDTGLKSILGQELIGVDQRFQVIAKRKKRKNIDTDQSDTDLLNSFYIEDLNATIDYIKKGGNNKLLNQFLEMDSIGERKDIRKDIEYVYNMLSPDKLPDACWATAGGYPLVYSQQFAINSIKERLLGNGGIYAVNGPPGTGKTTMLRDLIAFVVTERAKQIAKLKNPEDMFVSTNVDKAWKNNDQQQWYRKLKSEFLGYEIVVASSNNGAVENVTMEIPSIKSIDEKLVGDIDYFSELGSGLIGEDAWGSGAACLGNSSNKSRFISNFWHGTKSKENIYIQGFNDYLKGVIGREDNAKEIQDNWKKRKEIFADALAKVEQFKQEKMVLINKKKTIEEEVERLESILNKDNENIPKQEQTIEKLENQISELKKNYESLLDNAGKLKNEINELFIRKPSIIDIIFSFGKSWKKWNDKKDSLEKAEDELKALMVTKAKEVNDYETKLKIKRQLDYKKEELNSAISELHKEEKRNDDEAEREKSSPWTHDKDFQKARTEVFIAALNLHKAQIDANAQAIRLNLYRIMEVLGNKVKKSTANEEPVRHAWATLFLCVPVVSTTFASFGRLFSHLWDNKIGWLLIDEAGQASAKAAVGAMMRSKRAVIVGDPLQLEPIIGLPGSVQDILHKEINAHDGAFSEHTSVQKRADFTEIHGTYLESEEGEDTWVGSPLRVHRRCHSPMFEISNVTTYKGLMVQGKGNDDCKLPSSNWIDVPAMTNSGHWVEEEGNVAIELVRQLQDQGVDKNDIYLISPFRDVVNGLKNIFKVNRLIDAKKRVGTIHTVQGKEAKVVILVLGSDPNNNGARLWAASKPNLLNVAATRAKDRLYIIGNKAKWKDKQYFSDAVRLLD